MESGKERHINSIRYLLAFFTPHSIVSNFVDPMDIELDIAVSCVKIARGGELLVVGDYKNRVGVYNLKTGDLIQDLTGDRHFDMDGMPITVRFPISVYFDYISRDK